MATPTATASSTTRSSARARAAGGLLSLAVLGLTALAQAVIFVASGSVALLADLIHNAGDALTAIPLGIAFALRSRARRALRRPGGGARRSSSAPASRASRRSTAWCTRSADQLWALALAGALGFAGNWSPRRSARAPAAACDSPALIADGDHARADAYVSLAVVAAAAVVALGAPLADPLIGLAITLVILRITWRSWRTVRGHDHHHHR